MPDAQNFLQAMYKEQCDQARQHENLRQLSTTIVLTLAGAIVAAVSATAASAITALVAAKSVWMFAFYAVFGIFIAVLGYFGRSLSLKHYERNRMHSRRAGAYREKLESLFPDAHYDERLRDGAKAAHERRWRERGPKVREDVIAAHLYKKRMNIFSFIIWTGALLVLVSLLIAIFGQIWIGRSEMGALAL